MQEIIVKDINIRKKILTKIVEDNGLDSDNPLGDALQRGFTAYDLLSVKSKLSNLPQFYFMDNLGQPLDYRLRDVKIRKLNSYDAHLHRLHRIIESDFILESDTKLFNAQFELHAAIANQTFHTDEQRKKIARKISQLHKIQKSRGIKVCTLTHKIVTV